MENHENSKTLEFYIEIRKLCAYNENITSFRTSFETLKGGTRVEVNISIKCNEQEALDLLRTLNQKKQPADLKSLADAVAGEIAKIISPTLDAQPSSPRTPEP